MKRAACSGHRTQIVFLALTTYVPYLRRYDLKLLVNLYDSYFILNSLAIPSNMHAIPVIFLDYFVKKCSQEFV